MNEALSNSVTGLKHRWSGKKLKVIPETEEMGNTRQRYF